MAHHVPRLTGIQEYGCAQKKYSGGPFITT